MTLKQDKVNIHDLVKEVERNMLPKAEKKNITLTVSVNDIINKRYGEKTVKEWGYVPYVMPSDLKYDYTFIKSYLI